MVTKKPLNLSERIFFKIKQWLGHTTIKVKTQDDTTSVYTNTDDILVYTNMEGKAFRKKDFEQSIIKDKKDVIYVASWCAMCHIMISLIIEYLPEKEQQKIALVDCGEDKELRNKFINNLDLKKTAPNLYNNLYYPNKYTDDPRYPKIYGFPTVFQKEHETLKQLTLTSFYKIILPSQVLHKLFEKR